MLERSNLSHLKYFVDAAHLGSVTKAALKNRVSQSAVSQAIASLERMTGQTLLVHRRNKFSLSGEGRLLFTLLVPVLEGLQKVEDNFFSPDMQPQGDVEIVCPRSIAMSLLAPKLIGLKKKYPLLVPRLRMYTPDVARERLLSASTEIAFLIDNVDLSAFETILVHKGTFRLFRSKHHPNVPETQVMFTEERREVNLFRRAYYEAYGHTLDTHLEATSWDVIARFVDQGLGCGFLPDYVAQAFPDLEPIELKFPGLSYCIYATVRSLDHLSRNARAVLSCLCPEMSQEIAVPVRMAG
jgi:DNA-binding transcriptional LysR family regulator